MKGRERKGAREGEKQTKLMALFQGARVLNIFNPASTLRNMYWIKYENFQKQPEIAIENIQCSQK